MKFASFALALAIALPGPSAMGEEYYPLQLDAMRPKDEKSLELYGGAYVSKLFMDPYSGDILIALELASSEVPLVIGVLKFDQRTSKWIPVYHHAYANH